MMLQGGGVAAVAAIWMPLAACGDGGGTTQLWMLLSVKSLLRPRGEISAQVGVPGGEKE